MRLAKPSSHLLVPLALGSALCTLGLAGCLALGEHPVPPPLPNGEADAHGVRPLHHAVVASGRYAPFGDDAFAVHDWPTWTALKQHLRIDWDAEPDLDRNTVIAASVPGHGGVRVRFDSVYFEGGLLSERSRHTEVVGGQIVAAYTVEVPGDSCAVTMDMTTPYEVVAVGVTFDQEVLFTEVAEEVACAPHGL